MSGIKAYFVLVTISHINHVVKLLFWGKQNNILCMQLLLEEWQDMHTTNKLVCRIFSLNLEKMRCNFLKFATSFLMCFLHVLRNPKEYAGFNGINLWGKQNTKVSLFYPRLCFLLWNHCFLNLRKIFSFFFCLSCWCSVSHLHDESWDISQQLNFIVEYTIISCITWQALLILILLS